MNRDDALAGQSVISKVVSVLEAFSTDVPRLSLKQLAESTGLPQSTTYRLASELVAWGGLERVEGGGYQIGLRLWEIGALAVRGESLREIAVPFMQDLYNATRENVHLAILDGTEALYIEKITGRGAARAVSRRGGRLPLHATGVGKVLLAYAPGRPSRRGGGERPHALHSTYDRHAGTSTTSPDEDSPRRRRLRERGNVDGHGICRVTHTRVADKSNRRTRRGRTGQSRRSSATRPGRTGDGELTVEDRPTSLPGPPDARAVCLGHPRLHPVSAGRPPGSRLSLSGSDS